MGWTSSEVCPFFVYIGGQCHLSLVTFVTFGSVKKHSVHKLVISLCTQKSTQNVCMLMKMIVFLQAKEELTIYKG